MNTSKTDLLSQYAQSGDQQAFSQLVEDYIKIAYSAAITCLGSSDLAGDACQLTFLELANKAGKLPEGVKLGGWVYATARNFSRNIQRGEIRRSQREQNYVDHMKTTTGNTPDWSLLAPEIHEVLEELKPAERDAILLRFLQEKDLQEVGDVFGITADAARMRVNRALEQMNSLLGKRGICSTAVALAAALPAHAAVSVPSGLAESISTAVFATAGTAAAGTAAAGTAAAGKSLGTGGAIAIMKTKTALISTVAISAALTGTALYLNAQPEEPSAVAQPPAISVETSKPDSFLNQTLSQAAAGSERVLTGSEDSFADPKDNLRADASTKTIPFVPDADTDTDTDMIHIDQQYLEEANQMAKVLEAVTAVMDATLLRSFTLEDIDNPSKKLQLRLGLDPEVASRFDEILTEYRKAELDRSTAEDEPFIEAAKSMLKNSRQDMINLMALQAMKDAEEPLTDDQEAYLEELMARSDVDSFLKGGASKPRQWHEDPAVMSQLMETLSASQQKELEIYIEEQELRKIEADTYKRANNLANDLGLTEESRAALYSYLLENPDVSNEGIASQLSPELRDLMLQEKPLFESLPTENP